ncbi:type I polyketide synthase [Actinoplanes sp. NPDC048988]|uniref:type I polyketide synthase n=1 Tax=Actinoplanes sp. NPDC048988 TaxID=3363901 RepID=UPI00371FDF87
MANEQKLLDYLKLVTADLQQTRRRLAETETQAHEPIAIIAMACRYPGGVRGPEDLWELVAAGGDAVAGAPGDRGWDLPEGAANGAFLYDAADFDPAPFGLTEAEALAMDPQQRLLLETSWEAFERAGIDPHSLRGSATGVFAGLMYHDYASRLRWVPEHVAGYLGTGTTGSIASGRVAYTFGLEGPALTIDTACSSSLVALHLAAQSLRKGESSLALAGGVAVMATPAPFVSFADQGGLAHDGRCRSFAAAADGVGWAEGAGLLLLERLSDARRNGHPVHAVIRGSAVNSDGASSGLTAPNGPSQQSVIRQALASARLRPRDVDVVEAHGTGTRLGDPIEAQALLATYGQDRPAGEPLWLGSVKSNIGHAQAAAGAAGVMKMVYALRHGLLPRTLHVDEPTPQVDWESGDVRLLTEPRPWPAAPDRPRRAAVSSFGISGTNAHLIIEEAPASEPSATPATPATGLIPPLLLSAAGAEALAGQAARLAEHLRSNPGEPLGEVARSLVATRAALRHRAAILPDGREAAVAGLDALAAGELSSAVVRGVAGPARVAMVFAGQGAQRVGMGRELYAAAPAFAAALDEVCAVIDPILGESLRQVMFTGPAEKLDRTGYAQPALFAFEVAMVRLLGTYGVRPDAVLGHSVGELVAAHVAGSLPLEEAARLVTERGRLMQRLPAGGAMTAVEADEAEVAGLLDGRADLAAVNGPRSVVISGDEEAVDAIAAELRSRGRRTRRLAVSHAFHSHRMDPMLAEFRQVLAGVEFREPGPLLLSTVTGGAVTAADLADPAHWERNVRRPVRFAATAAALPSAGRFAAVLEIGPDAVLTPMVEQCLAGADPAPVAVPVLRAGAGAGETRHVADALARLFVAGVEVDWNAAGPRPAYRALPTYAFDRTRLWLDGVPPGDAEGAAAAPPVETEFWAAVERGDLDGLAATLTVGTAELESLRTLVPALSAWRRSSRAEAAVGAWRYRIGWRPFTPEPGHPAGTWLLLGTEGHAVPDGDLLAAALAAGGADVVTRTVAPGRDEVAGALHEVIAEHGELTGVLSLPARAGLAATLDLVRLLGDEGVGAPLWCLTRHAVAVDAADVAPDPAQAEIWGLGRVVGLEHADRWGGLVDLPARLDERTARAVAAVLADGRGEDQVAVRGSGVHVRRLRRAPLDRSRRPWRPAGTVLITGGTGGIGAHVARALAAAGAPHLLLASRRGPGAPGVPELVAELAGLGCAAEAVACDMTDRRDVAALLAGIPDERPLTAVLHAAGAPQYRPVAELDAAALAEVSAAKVTGADLLDELLSDRDLDAFVLFSSAAAVWGSSGSGGYAAANAHLDALAEARRRRGLRATSVAWGGWAGGGMVDALGERMLERQGLPVMDPALAVSALRHAIEADETCVTVADVDWPRFAATFTLARRRPLLDEIPEAAAEAGPAVRPASALAGRLRELPEAEARDSLVRLVLDEATAVLGETAAEPVVASRAFRDMGFDSMAAVELRNRLAAAAGVRLPATLVFDHPTPERLAAYLFTDLTGAATGAATTAAATADTGEPVAIVGMACRYPGGVASPEDLWRLVADGTDAIGPFPRDRGWDLDGAPYGKDGGFLDGAGDFDPLFFGISPREAQATDPQQWLLLETSWEAFERAGIDPRTLEGSPTGVFVGGASAEFAGLLAASGADILGHGLTGTSASVMSGRIAYTYGLQGPAVTIDTACSSSLVAIHLAMQSLRNGESSLALAGGVTVMATPAAFAEFTKQGGLAGDGRCRSYAAAADGTGWGEGAGLLVLERLSDAERNGHRVLAVIRGSAINQDGASNGLTAPNGPAQQRVIGQALANAGLAPQDVDAVEGHGTATTLGDPIEAQALLATYGQNRAADRPLWLGSVKSNIGHTQSAAGVAGVIKMVMALRHATLPPTLHVDEPTPRVDWSTGAVRLLTAGRAWPAVDRPRRAAVSSFGASGTNAHLILEEAAPGPDVPAEPGEPLPVLLSGRTPAALRRQARRLLDHLTAHPPASLARVAYTLATTRRPLEHRAGIDAAGTERLLPALAALAEDAPAADVATGAAVLGKTVFVFPGQGAQWPGMAADLIGTDPVFTERMHECAAALAPHVDFSVLDVVRGEPGAPSLDRVDVVQPVLFAVMLALAEMWRAAGVRPEAVIGHSQGEIAAAVFAGALTLDDGARVVALRSRALTALGGHGGMVSVPLPEQEVSRLLDGQGNAIGIAAVNGPRSTVVSGEPAAVRELLDRCAAENVAARRVEVDYASHSAQVESMRETLAELLAPVTPRSGELPLYSTLTGARLDGAEMDAGYWFRNLRDQVRLHQAVGAALGDGYRAFVECSPHPVLTIGVRETLEESGVAGWAGGTLRRDEAGRERFRRSLTEAWAHGVPVDWARLAPWGRRPSLDLELPTYPFEHQHYWLTPRAGTADVAAAGLVPAGHPLLAAEVELPGGHGVVFSGTLARGRQAWLPAGPAGAVLVELVTRAGDRYGSGRLAELTVHEPPAVPDEGLQLRVFLPAPDGAEGYPVEVYARPAGAEEDAWSRLATGRLAGDPAVPAELPWPPPEAEPVPAPPGVRALWQSSGARYAEVELTGREREEAASYGLHPALLDRALSVLDGVVPAAWSGVTLHASGADSLRVRLTTGASGAVRIDAADPLGAPVLTVEAVTLRSVDDSPARSWRYRVRWLPVPVPAAPRPSGAWLVISSPGSATDPVAAALAEGGAAVREVPADPAALARAAAGTEVAGVLFRPLSGDPAEALTVLRALIDAGLRAPVWWLTTGAVSAGPADAPPVPERAPVWGFARVAALEHPELWGGLIDMPADPGRETVDRVVAVLHAGADGEDQVAVRAEGVYARRMMRAATPAPAGAPWQPRGTVLVTGGTGAVGGHVARWLARSGAEHVVVTGRRGPEAPGAADLARELRAAGAEATVASCDVADRAALAALLDRIGPVSAVVHAAGTGQFTMIGDTGAAELAAVLSGKVDGARHLDELLEGHELDAFVLFSSGAAIWGSAGQAGYAAANTYLDALAEARRARGAVATSVAWGSWAGGGMVDDAGDAMLRRRGIRRMDPGAALLAMRDAVDGAEPTAVVADIDWAAFVPSFTLIRARPLISDIPEVRAALRDERDGTGSRRPGPARRSAATSADVAGTELAARLAGMPPGERRRHLYETVRAHIAAVLGEAVRDAVEPDRPFKALGFDSLSAVELRNRLGAAAGLRLPATLVFDHPTPAAVVDLLLAEFGAAEEIVPAAAEAPAGSAEPIAIVGMGCRYPGGVTTPEDLWRLVAAGTDAVADIPADRGWDLDRLYGQDAAVRATGGGFLADVAGFDAAFFGISPREATVMDPQQRLLLETAWEALERAGTDPSSIRGTRTGVFVGGSSQDYVAHLSSVADDAAGHLLSGTAGSVLSGRLAYVLGAEGPTVTVDTACSSSLVALHLAAQSLRTGESTLALAGGVSVLFTPVLFAEFSRQGGLAPDGRCKAFAAAADGTGWAEGAGLLVLERLSDARRNGRRILAVLRGSAVNQDGASNGLTAPNGPSQQRVIRQALGAAGIEPGDVDVVEAHGTGTTLGDPIEAQALLATYGRERPAEAPLWLGSIKSNIGHAQAAAGVAGVIKMVQALRHGTMPPTLHVDEPSPEVDWSAGAVRLLTEPRDWPSGDRPRRAGVSAFGISGTNAHVILEEAPAPVGTPPDTPAGSLPVLLSARSAAALAVQAARLREHLLDRPQDTPVAVAGALVAGRAHLRHRAALRAADRDGLLAALDALSSGRAAPGLFRGVARGGPLAVILPGQGAQRPGMGRDLYERRPAFRAALDELCGALLAAGGPGDLLEVMFAADDARLHRTEYAQPALFAYEAALYRDLESSGVRADIVAGHSVGELTAAYLCGALGLADACRMVVARGALMQRLPGGGGMTAIGASEAEVAAVLAAEPGVGGRAGIAAVNGPRSVVVSGDADAVDAVASRLAARGHRTRPLTVSHAFHSAHMEPMLDAFAEVTADLTVHAPDLTMISTVTGRAVEAGTAADPGHWRANVRSTVRFSDALDAILAAGATTVLEVGPATVLTSAVHEAIEGAEPGRRPAVLSVARSGRAGPESVLDALAGLHVAGAHVDWPAARGATAVAADLPTYPFEHQRFWLTASAGAARGDVAAAGLGAVDHPVLSAMLDQPETGGVTLTGAVSVRTHPWLADHAVAGGALFPGTAFAELFVQAGDALGCDRVQELVLRAPLLVPDDATVALQVTVGAAGSGEQRPVQVFARAGAAADWTLHATGAVRPGTGTTRPTGPAHWPPPGAEPVELDGFHDRIAERGLAYGPSFRGLRAAWRDRDGLWLEAALPVEAGGFALHPALLDAVLQGVALDSARDVGVPFSFTGLSVHATGATTVRARLTGTAADGFHVAVTDPEGSAVAEIESLALRVLDPRRSANTAGLLAPEWIVAPGTVDEPPRREMWVLAGADGPEAGRRLSAGGLLLVEDPDPAGALGHGVTRHAVAPVRPDAALPAGPAGVHAEVARVLRILQEWLAADVPAGSRLVVLTERAAAVRPGEDVTGLAGAAVHGLVRAAQSEHPGRIVLVDVDDVTAAAGLLPLATATALALDEPVVAVRDGEIRLPRLTAVPAPSSPVAPPVPSGTVLVVGAGGALGGLVARHLVTAHGARDLLLIGRRGDRAPGAAELTAGLTALGARVTWAACDAADATDLEKVVENAEPAVTGVVHAGGVLDDGVLAALTPERLFPVLRPKVDAAWNLHRLTERHPISMFVLFSSTAGTFGTAGQANYAAANAYLDALATHRRALGLPAHSLAWGLWDVAGGMAGQVGDRRWKRSGTEGLTPEQGLSLMDAALGGTPPVVVAARLDRRHPSAAPAPALLRGAARTRPVARPDRDAPAGLRTRLAGMPGPDRMAALHDVVRSAAAGVLGHPGPAAIADADVFAELGFDSLMSVELRNALAATTGVSLATTVVFDHPTISGLAAELHDSLTAGPAAAPPEAAGEPEYDGDGTTLAALYRRASELGEYVDGTTMLQLASRFRPSFRTAEESTVRPELIRLCAGPAGPPLICFPSPTVFGGPHEYTPLAAELRGRRDVWSPVYPGFVAGERLPADFAALVDFLAAGVLARTGGGPCTVVGRSSGGTVAHLVAARLEELGAPVSGLVLLDTYPPSSSALHYILPVLQKSSLDAEAKVGPMTDVRLTAMAGYFGFFGEWSMKPVKAPTVLMRASELVPADEPPKSEADWRSSWPLEHTVLDVPGNHFTMMAEEIASTAAAIEEWIGRTAQDKP